MKTNVGFPTLLTRFFTDRLIQQRHASPHTIASYRDTFRLLLHFAHQRLAIEPARLSVPDVDAPLINAFLDHLETDRNITGRTRNLRLTAIRSFFRYIAYEVPDHAAQIQRILAIPAKRCDHAQVNYLTRPEVDALLSAPDQSTWSGRRDHAWILLAVQTGLRASELTGLTHQDISLGTGAHVHVMGKGRKERCTPLTKAARGVLKAWMEEPMPGDGRVLFPNRGGGRLSNDGVQYLLAKHVTVAGRLCPSLRTKSVSPHVLRHTSAMELLHAGVDTSVIALWLGHESSDTTQIYLEADLAMKEEMLAKVAQHTGRPSRYQPDDTLLEFLKSL